jgi:hypothetical protein
MRTINVNASSQELESIVLDNNKTRISVQVKNTGSVALSDFRVCFRATKYNEYIIFYSQESDWDSIEPGSLIRLAVSNGSATNPVTLAPGEEILFYLEDIEGFYDVKFEAQTAANSTTIEIGVGA